MQCSFTCSRQSDKCCILTEPTMKAECCCRLTRLYQACMNRNIEATTATSVTELQLKSVFILTHHQYIHHLNNKLKHQSERSNQTIWVNTPVWTQHGWGGHIKPPQLNYYVTILLNVCPVTKSVVCQWCHKNVKLLPEAANARVRCRTRSTTDTKAHNLTKTTTVQCACDRGSM